MSATGDAADAAADAIANDNAGFTLLEMLVVLAIAALVAGIGFPRLQAQVAAQEWRTGVAAVTTLLRAARAQAIRGGQVATVSVAGDGRSLRITDGATLALPASLAVTLARPLTFYADGSASGGTIIVAGARRSATLAVAPATGLAIVRTS